MSRRTAREMKLAALTSTQQTNVVSITDPLERKVTVIRDSALTFPELWLDVFLAGESPGENALFAEMFLRARCSKSDDPLKADLVVFGGGADVDPMYYQEDPHSKTHSDPKRDLDDIALYEVCLHNGIPMFGVCRGAQFLHVMNGGKLFQDVDNHVGDHYIRDNKSGQFIDRVSSVHHQACILNPDGMEVLAHTQKSKTRWLNPLQKEEGLRTDIEAFFYRETACLGVQGHPEYRGYNAFMQWTLEQINDLIICNPDITYDSKFRRLSPDIRGQRDAKWAMKAKELN